MPKLTILPTGNPHKSRNGSGVGHSARLLINVTLEYVEKLRIRVYSITKNLESTCKASMDLQDQLRTIVQIEYADCIYSILEDKTEKKNKLK